MIPARAAQLLAEEHPEFAFNAVQLQSLCRKQLVPCIQLPTCGTQRRYRYMVHYPTLVKHLQGCLKTAIS